MVSSLKVYLHSEVSNICLNEDNNNIRVSSMSIILLIFMSDIFFLSICLMRDVLPLLFTKFYDYELIKLMFNERMWKRLSNSMGNKEYNNFNL